MDPLGQLQSVDGGGSDRMTRSAAAAAVARVPQ